MRTGELALSTTIRILLLSCITKLIKFGSIIIYVVDVIFSHIALCSGSEFLGPKNITRTEGSKQQIVPCQSYPIQATPFWKINDTIYYYSDLPLPLTASKSGREIIIPTVDSTLSGTSFQCFTPSSSGDELISSSIGVLTVIANGIYNS